MKHTDSQHHEPRWLTMVGIAAVLLLAMAAGFCLGIIFHANMS